MQRLKYRITTLAPILIADTKGGNNYVTTAEFIPGSSILGLLAAKYVKLNSLVNSAHTDEGFQKFFLSDKLRFDNAYIISKNERDEIINNLPIPLSVQYDKDDKTRVYDLLFQEPKENDEKIQTKPFSEFGIINGNTVYYQPVKKSLNFHHERDPKTGSTKKGLIFNYESINSKQVFEGYILGDKNIIEEFKSNFGTPFEARIGRSRNVQYGRVKFEFVDKIEELKVEIKNLTDVTLTFLSDVILYDDNGFSTTDESVLLTYLRKKIINNSHAFEVIKYFTKDNVIENYVSVWKLKRPSEVSFKAGSCFLLKGITVGDKTKLEELQKEGIGERRNEGYGRIVFNYQKAEINSAENCNEIIIKVTKPSFPIPDIAKEKLKMIIQDLLIKQTRYKAINDENSFTDKSSLAKSKSLVSRLESFVKGSPRKDEFDIKLKLIRKTAIEKLERCRMSRDSFYNWLLKKNDITASKILEDTKMTKVREILNDISYNVENDSNFNNKLYKEYFLTFFSALRKSLKRIGG